LPSTAAGCDDGRVIKLESGTPTLFACTSMTKDGRILLPGHAVIGVISTDGLDATSILAHAIKVLSLKHGGLDAVFLDSVQIAGFNVASPSAIYKLTGVPVIVAYTYRPSFARLAKAASQLQTYKFIEAVLRLVDKTVEVETIKGVLYILPWGISASEAVNIIENYQVHARKPEPLRLAHYLASSLSSLRLNDYT
jgi:endonuclease V-like protein UPF0215 family